MSTNKIGLVKAKLLVPHSTLQLEPWYFGLYPKKAAERQLFKESYRTGTFLVRKNEYTGKNKFCEIQKKRLNLNSFIFI